MPEPVNDIRNWRVVDPAPHKDLHCIEPYSQRAAALIVRSATKSVLQTDFLQVAGAVSMLNGLDYHRDRFVSLIAELAGGAVLDQKQLLHEAVAYVNRAGQFYYFAESGLVKAKGVPPSIPRLSALVKFRHKHTAHRSIDKPWPQDTEQLQTVHAMALSEFGGMLWHPKEKPPPDFSGPFWDRAYLAYQIHTDPSDVYELVIERDHEALMQEAYEVLLHVLQ